MARAKHRMGGMAALSNLVEKVYPGDKLEEIQTARIFGWWYRAVPERVTAHARPMRLHRGVLWIHTSSATWAQHLQHLRDQLLLSVQRQSPVGAVRDLRFRVGPLPPPMQVPKPRERPPVLPLAELPEAIAIELAHIRDDALRNAIMQAAATALAPPPKADPKDRS